MRQQGRARDEGRLYMHSEQILGRGRGAAIGEMGGIHSRDELEVLE